MQLNVLGILLKKSTIDISTIYLLLQEVQQTVAEKTSALEAEAFKTKRMQEETAILKRKVK